jgi:hypothetical protein
MADDSFGRRTPFAFLQDIKEKFLATYDRQSALNAPIYGMNEFSKVIAKQMVRPCISIDNSSIKANLIIRRSILLIQEQIS